MKKYLLLAILGALHTCFLNSQAVSDLHRAYKAASNDEEALQALIKIADLYTSQQIDSAIFYFAKAAELANQIGNTTVEVEALNEQSELYMDIGSNETADSILKIAQAKNDVTNTRATVRIYQNLGTVALTMNRGEEAISYLKLALQLAEKTESIADMVPNVLINLGSFHFKKGDIPTSTQYLLRAIEMYKVEEDWENVAVIYLNMAINALSIEDYTKAYEYAQEGLVYAEEANHNIFMAHSYLVLAASGTEINLLDDALNYGRLALSSWKEIGNPYQIGLANRFVGKVLKTKGKVEESISYLEESVKSFTSIDVVDQLIYSQLELGEGYLLEGKKQEGLRLLQEGEELINKIHDQPIDVQNINQLLENGYAIAGLYDKAYKYRMERDVIRDSILQKEKLDRIAELETEYQVKEKEAQLAITQIKVSRQRQLILFASLVIGLLLLTSFLIWRNNVQRQKINEQLIRLDESKSRFFANISHELRTPLTLIMGPLENALNKVKPTAGIKKDLELALDNSDQLLNLVNEILDLSKLESGKLELTLNSVNLYTLVHRIFTSFESMAEIQKIQLTMEYGLDKNLKTDIDIPKFEKILNNLISNAIKFTPQGGTVKLVANRSEERWVEISVTDTGEGIKEEHLQKIFNRYFQGNNSKNYTGGTGIGLALSKELTELHGGELNVMSQKGEGSTFTLLLPMVLQSYHKRPTDILTYKDQNIDYQPVIALGNRPSVLVIDDNESMRSYLKDLLSPHFKVSFAVDGKDGLDKLHLDRYDAITCDVMMPNMDGFEFLKALRAQEIKQHTPSIMLTARNLEEDKLRALRLGTDDYVTKPFSGKELIARLNNLIANKKSREEELIEEVEELESVDTKMLKKAESFVIQNISNEKYGVTDLATDLNYSSRQLSRILKKLTGMNSNQFIREIRLQKAYQLIQHRQYATISEVRFEVGIAHASYFTREFERRFGVKPSEV